MSARFPFGSGALNPGVLLDDFRGGRINVPEARSISELQDYHCQKAINVDTTGGSSRKARGFVKASNAPVTGDLSTIWYDNNMKRTVVTYDDKWGILASGAITAVSDATGFTPNKRFRFARLNDYVMGVNGFDAPKLWNTTAGTVGLITTPPSTWGPGKYPKTCANWANRIFAPVGRILHYSKLFLPTDWTPGTGAADGGAINIGDDTDIVAIIPFHERLVVLKRPGLYVMFGNSKYSSSAGRQEFDQTTFDFDEISSAVDCVGPDAWVLAQDKLYVWGTRAVYEISASDTPSGIAVRKISARRIDGDIKNIANLREEIIGVHYEERDQLWFGVASGLGSTQLDAVHVYSYNFVDPEDKIGAWNLRTGYAHKCMARVFDDNGLPQIYSGGYGPNSYVYRQNEGRNWDDKPMECTFWTAFVKTGAIERSRSPYCIFMLGGQTRGSLQWTYAYDYNTDYYDGDTLDPPEGQSAWNKAGGSTWGSKAGGSVGTWTSGSSVTRQKRIYGKGRRIQHRFYSNALDADFDILEIMHPISSVGFTGR